MTGTEAIYAIFIFLVLAAAVTGLSMLKKALKRYSSKSCTGRS